MVKLLFLQGCYSISDEELEFQVNDRITFRNFLDFPESIPDFSTIWRFRENLADKDIIDKIWAELHRQISDKNIQVKEEVIQERIFYNRGAWKEKWQCPKRKRSQNIKKQRWYMDEERKEILLWF